jgi:segregation and condensation protein A
MGDRDLQITLDVFEGPLDLLLHLVRVNEYDIFDIPVAAIARQYNEYLDLMRDLNLNIAGEYLVMSATLLRVKSRMLLPLEAVNEDGEEVDPREELVQQLLEYQRYKEAAREMLERPLLGRDVFARKFPSQELADAAIDASYLDVDIYQLLQALRSVIKNLPQDVVHEVQLEGVSIREKMSAILETIRERRSLRFEELFAGDATRGEVIATFLAMLELVRQAMIKLTQIDLHGPIRIESLLSSGEDADVR